MIGGSIALGYTSADGLPATLDRRKRPDEALSGSGLNGRVWPLFVG